FMAMAYAALREAAGQGETEAFAASEFPRGIPRSAAYAAPRSEFPRGTSAAYAAPRSEFPARRRWDRVVAITRSGTTTEVLAALAATDAPTTVVVGDPDSPATEKAGHAIRMPFADENSVVQTRFATSTLILLRAHLGEDLSTAAADAAEAVRVRLPLDPDAT